MYTHKNCSKLFVEGSRSKLANSVFVEWVDISLMFMVKVFVIEAFQGLFPGYLYNV